MGRKTMLLLSARDCQAYIWQKGDFSEGACFTEGVEGRERFTQFLQNHRTPVYLLTDLVEEDFRHETLPHLQGKDRVALIQRKLEQYYRNTPFRQAATLQRCKDGRRDDMMLFSALTNPSLITPWLDIILAHNLPIVGIYSLANVCGSLVKDIYSEGLLLLSWNKNAGLRQTYFHENKLQFSRLTPLGDGHSFVSLAGTEAVRTQQYLKNISLLPPDQVLNVTILCHENDRIEFEAQMNNNSEMHYNYLDIQVMGRHVGVKTIFDNSDATLLYLHLLASQLPHTSYATVEHTCFLQLMTVRRSLIGLSAILAAISLMWAFTNINAGKNYQEEIQSVDLQGSHLSQQIRQFIKNSPNTLVTATDMKTAVILSQKLEHIFLPPQVILNALSKTLDDYSTIRINKLFWQTNLAAIPPLQVIVINGELEEFSGDYRSALEYLERFRQALILRGVSVTALTLPLDISPQGSIDAEACNGENKLAQFSLKISWQAVK